MELTGDDVDTIHDAALNRVRALAGADLCLPIQVLSYTGAAGTIHSNSVNLVG